MNTNLKENRKTLAFLTQRSAKGRFPEQTIQQSWASPSAVEKEIPRTEHTDSLNKWVGLKRFDFPRNTELGAAIDSSPARRISED
jgi:hypothetical protein